MVMDDNGAGFCLVGGKFGVAGVCSIRFADCDDIVFC